MNPELFIVFIYALGYSTAIQGAVKADGNELEALRRAVKRLDVQVNMLVEENQQLSQRLRVLEEDFVGFTVYTTSTRSYNEGEIVQFQGVKSNYGDGFDTSTSKFVCPVSGYYLFSITVFSAKGSNRASLLLKVGDTTFLYAYTDDDTTFYHQATNTGVVLCSAGTEVKAVARFDGDEIFAESNSDIPHTTFTGALLRITA